MAQRKSGYERKPRDLYETPSWVTSAVYPYIPDHLLELIWEPACAGGKMSEVVDARYSSDLVTDYGDSGVNFLEQNEMPEGCRAIVTNPPFNKEAERFIRHGIRLLTESSNLNVKTLTEEDHEVIQPVHRFIDGEMVPDYRIPGFMAMLLPVDFDSGKTRRDIFAGCPQFSAKIVLTSRIVWFEKDSGANPSANHAWFLWDWSKPPQAPANIYYHFKE